MELGRPARVFGYPISELREGAYFATSLSAQNVYNDIDKWMLARLSTLDATGIYTTAYRLIDISFVPVRSVLAAAYPRFFQQGAHGARAGLRLARRLLPLAVAYAAVAGLALFVLAPEVPRVLGRAYEASVAATRWLAILPLLKSIHYFAADTLTGAGYQGRRTMAQIVVAAFNVIVNVPLIAAASLAGRGVVEYRVRWAAGDPALEHSLERLPPRGPGGPDSRGTQRCPRAAGSDCERGDPVTVCDFGARRLGYLSGAPRVTTRPDAEIGGPRSHILGVMSGFRQLGWSIEPYIVGDRSSPGVVTRDAGKLLRKGGQWALLADMARIGLSPLNSRAAWRGLAGRVDWVYERFSVFQALGRAFAQAGVPWILETNEMQSEEARVDRNSLVLTSLARRHERQAYLDCSMLVCVSEALKQLITTRLGVPGDKIAVVPNGVDTDFFRPRPNEPRAFEGFTLVYAGGIEPWQGIDLLLRAMADLRNDGLPVHAVIAGDGPVRRDCERLAGELGLGPYVQFLGTVSREAVPHVIASGDLGYSGHTECRVAPSSARRSSSTSTWRSESPFCRPPLPMPDRSSSPTRRGSSLPPTMPAVYALP